MGKSPVSSNRRGFIKKAATVTTGLVGISLFSSNCWSKDVADEGINVIGPKEGFSPQVGTLVSMMNWMRETILQPVQNLSVEQLDYLHDSKSNSIGAMLLHLAATERYYQLHTFEGKKWGSWDENIKTQWDLPMNLGEAARKTIKGRNLDYYLNALKEVRQSTLLEFQRRDDRWLMAVDKEWGWGPTNNYCKWFHVCEHESNHNGQIKWIKSRLPGAKSSGD
jgi:uncharacterized damage-inducible protein DinB